MGERELASMVGAVDLVPQQARDRHLMAPPFSSTAAASASFLLATLSVEDTTSKEAPAGTFLLAFAVSNVRRFSFSTKPRPVVLWGPIQATALAAHSRMASWDVRRALACCFACCCPQIVASQARSTYDGSDCWFNCLCMPLALTRNVIRQGYHMEGGWIEDCVLSACCALCVAAQLAYEVADRGPIKSLGKVLAPNQVVPEGAFMVSVPPGAVHGTTLSVTKPSTGQPMLVMVPPGVVAGQQFMVVG